MSEYDITGAGNPRSVEGNAVSHKPRTALDRLGRQIQWVHSSLTRDRVHYGYRVPDEAFEPAAAVAYVLLTSN
jgi:hypothetical protein